MRIIKQVLIKKSDFFFFRTQHSSSKPSTETTRYASLNLQLPKNSLYILQNNNIL